MKKIFAVFIVFFVIILAACGTEGETEGEQDETAELAVLEVEFIVPDTADPGETVQLEAVVTYGEELVEDADDVVFEYWLKGNEDDSLEEEGVHTKDGSYVAEVSFPEDGVYEMYAHTTAHELHTMPLASIEVGDAEESTEVEEEEKEHSHHYHTDGFHLDFMDPKAVSTGEETDLVVQIQLDEEPLENARVRYEILPEGKPEKTIWVDAEETVSGEYTATHSFEETGTYTFVIHVEDDADLHEHAEYSMKVD